MVFISLSDLHGRNRHRGPLRAPPQAVSIAGLLATFAAALVLIPRYGASGAAVASAVGYAVGGALAWLLFVRLAREPEPGPQASFAQTAKARL